MTLTMLGALLAAGVMAQQAPTPVCESGPNRRAERLDGEVKRGEPFRRQTSAGWILRLEPNSEGWFLQVTTIGREAEDLSRLTPPWHFVPNPREIEGWHFRNADNTGPNDGSVNAPQQLRDFIFSPAVGREIDYDGSATRAEDVAKVQAFGRGWIFVETWRLTPARRGERAAFETMTFSACLTWPADAALTVSPERGERFARADRASSTSPEGHG